MVCLIFIVTLTLKFNDSYMQNHSLFSQNTNLSKPKFALIFKLTPLLESLTQPRKSLGHGLYAKLEEARLPKDGGKG